MKLDSRALCSFIKNLRGSRDKPPSDDFDWKSYNVQYRSQVKDIAKEHAQVLREGDYTFDGNSLIRAKEDLLPLHPNHRLLYETIIQLSPASLFELGCGGGDHLHNLGLLLEKAQLYGVDISDAQLRFLKERHPGLNADTKQFDSTLPFPSTFPRVDTAYTQAVLMHIQTGNGHMVALYNLFSLATRHVVLMENWTRHEFMADINRLRALKLIPWEEVHFYYRDSEEFRRPHLMIVSAAPLPQYKPLRDYALLRDAVPAD